MTPFQCRCGFSVSAWPPLDTLGHFIGNGSWEAWVATVAQTLAAFAKASAEGRRRQWLGDSGFGEEYPIEGRPDAGVIGDVISATYPEFQWDVYRCHACKRLYLPEAPGSGRWVVYSLEQSLERQPWPGVEELPGVMRPATDTADPDSSPSGNP